MARFAAMRLLMTLFITRVAAQLLRSSLLPQAPRKREPDRRGQQFKAAYACWSCNGQADGIAKISAK